MLRGAVQPYWAKGGSFLPFLGRGRACDVRGGLCSVKGSAELKRRCSFSFMSVMNTRFCTADATEPVTGRPNSVATVRACEIS